MAQITPFKDLFAELIVNADSSVREAFSRTREFRVGSQPSQLPTTEVLAVPRDLNERFAHANSGVAS